MKSYILILVAMLVVTVSAFAETGDAGQPAAFRHIISDARALGMGGAYITMAPNTGALLHNPALLSRTTGNHFNSPYRSLTMDRQVYGFEFCRPIPGNAGIGVMWNSATAGRIMGYDYDANPTELLTNSQNMFLVGFGRPIIDKYLSFGVASRMYWLRLDETQATGFGFSFGFASRPFAGLQIGVMAADVFGTLRWEDIVENQSKSRETIPLLMKAGASYTLFDRLAIAAEIESEHNTEYRHHFGAEYKLSPALALRVGADHLSPTAGATVLYPNEWGTFHFDYAFTSDSELNGYGHSVNLGLDL